MNRFLLAATMSVSAAIFAVTAAADPLPALPDRFKVRLFAEFNNANTPGGAADDAFEITITNGSEGFPAGMIVTGGPGTDSRLFSIDRTGTISVLSNDFNGSESLVFARGPYGDGALISEPRETRIRRLRPNGDLSTFADLGTAPFGPADLAFGADNNLYVSDWTGQRILRVGSDGSSSIFASLALPANSPTALVQAKHKPLAADLTGRYGGAFVAGTFSLDVFNTGIDSLYSLSAQGTLIDELASGLNALELVTFGPGDQFGEDLFLATAGWLGSQGTVFTLGVDGSLTAFLTGIDAAHVAFDQTGLFGGDMFVSELSLEGDVSRIWRVSPVPFPQVGSCSSAA